jgi:hypothetical protein
MLHVSSPIPNQAHDSNHLSSWDIKFLAGFIVCVFGFVCLLECLCLNVSGGVCWGGGGWMANN